MALIFPKSSLLTPKTNTILLIITLIITSSLVLQTLALPKSSQSNFFKQSRSQEDEPSISTACETTPFPSACYESLLTLSSSSHGTKQALFDHSVQFSMTKTHSARALAYNLTLASPGVHQGSHVALDDCLDLLDDTLDLLSGIVLYQRESEVGNDNVHTWLSAALTNQETCLESLDMGRFDGKAQTLNGAVMSSTAKNLSEFISNSLFLFVSSKPAKNSEHHVSGGTRKLLSSGGGGGGRFPSWTTAGERRLLESPVEEIVADAVVAKDGSGTHRTIAEAIEAVAAKPRLGFGESKAEGGGRTVIHVKEGTYNEYIRIPTKQKNVMLIGDGKGKSVIVGNKNSEDGSTTYNSATVGAMGDGFIARDLTIVNNAGPQKHQAVALRVGSDRAVIFRCSIQGYQDSLYTHSKRQFYRETDIYGTVDFIFGNSAAVFQVCNILVRKPGSSGLNNFVTAQGRSSPDQNTGISIHNCRIAAASDLAPVKSKFRTYLGRPWKQYSRTVIMESFLDDSITSAGWSPWSGGFALKTLFYGEYLNTGPGASTGGRVGWGGYHSSLTAPQANSFTVAGFISGNVWLPSTGVSFDSGLVG